jgi:hypothetical protein
MRIVKSRRMRWERHEACMKGKCNACGILAGEPDNIKLDLREIDWVVFWTGLIWLGIGTSGGLL